MPQFIFSARQLTNASGRDYLLRVWRPAKSGADQKLATLLLLDGQWLNTTIERALNRHAPDDVQIVSLGYVLEDRPTLAPWRAYDYTPTGPAGQTQDPRTPHWPCGGADALLDFLHTTVLEVLKDEFPIDPERRALFGHSYAGLFSLYCLARAPELFSYVYAASPSLWWSWPYALTNIAQCYPGLPGQGWPPVDLLVGSEERVRLQPAQPDIAREPGTSTLPYAQAFVAMLQAGGHPRAALHIFADLAHGPMFSSAAESVLAHFMRHGQPSSLQPLYPQS